MMNQFKYDSRYDSETNKILASKFMKYINAFKPKDGIIDTPVPSQLDQVNQSFGKLVKDKVENNMSTEGDKEDKLY